MFPFLPTPAAPDYQSLASHLSAVKEKDLHPALWSLRVQIAARLRDMAQKPECEEHRAAYHALRLFVW